MYTITGLGNPGLQYHNTRHNAGFIAIDRLQQHRDFPVFSLEKKWNSYISKGTFSGETIILIKPLSFMNRSGGPVSQINNFYKITPEQTIVLHDEIDLPIAKIKHKIGGGHAGHNGIRDIIARLGDRDFHRIRIGVDRPANKEDVTPYVLGKFSAQQKIQLDSAKEEIDTLIQAIITNQ